MSAPGDILGVAMRRFRAFGGLPIFGAAAVGVVTGHWIAYGLALPDHHVRDSVLAATGHGHWMLVVKLAVAFGLAGVATIAARFASRTPPEAGADAFTWAVTRIALVQAVAFIGMETIERMATGVPVAGMLSHNLLALGLAAQLLVACAGGAVLFLLSRAVERVARAVRSLPHLAVPPATVVRPAEASLVHVAVARHAGIRGPPRH
jgi:hypothetical protein